MTSKEKFNKRASHYFNIAKDPYFIGVSAVFALCALPFSSTLSAIAVSAPLAYAAVGAGCKAIGHSMQP